MFLNYTDLDAIEWKISKSFAEQSHNRFNSASKSDNWSSTVSTFIKRRTFLSVLKCPFVIFQILLSKKTVSI